MHLRSSERKILEEAFNRVIDKWCLDSYGVLDISEDSELALVLGAVSKFLPIPILSRDNIPIILQNFFVRKVNEYEQANPRPSYPRDTVVTAEGDRIYTAGHVGGGVVRAEPIPGLRATIPSESLEWLQYRINDTHNRNSVISNINGDW